MYMYCGIYMYMYVHVIIIEFKKTARTHQKEHKQVLKKKTIVGHQVITFMLLLSTTFKLDACTTCCHFSEFNVKLVFTIVEQVITEQ